jgi:ribonuclease PH
MRKDGRRNDEMRPIKVTRGFTKTPAGSVLWEQGNTVVLCTASVTQELPPWMKEDRPGGWITAEYVMLPASTPSRKPWPKMGHTDSRGTEIQRLIGRSLRAAIDLAKIGPHTIAIDCQVLQADGGTRTAAICGGYLALVDAVAKLPPRLPGARAKGYGGQFDIGGGSEGGSADLPVPARYDEGYYDPKTAIVEQLAAVSVGVIDGEVRLDLDYHDDSRAEVDMNVAFTAAGHFVEVQGSAENGQGFDRRRMDTMMDLAVAGCRQLFDVQNRALGGQS